LAGTVAEVRPGRRGPASAVLARRSLARAAGEPAALADVRVAVALAVVGAALVGAALVGAALVGAALRREVAVRSAVAIAIKSLLDGSARPDVGSNETWEHERWCSGSHSLAEG